MFESSTRPKSRFSVPGSDEGAFLRARHPRAHFRAKGVTPLPLSRIRRHFAGDFLPYVPEGGWLPAKDAKGANKSHELDRRKHTLTISPFFPRAKQVARCRPIA